MTVIGTPRSSSATRLMLLGSGELGKEVAIEAQRLGVEVIAVDRYANAPAMQVAHASAVINMLDPVALEGLIREWQPDLVVPEIEAIHTATLAKLEAEGQLVIPTARATQPRRSTSSPSTAAATYTIVRDGRPVKSISRACGSASAAAIPS